MNRNIVEGHWKQFKGKVDAWRCKLTDDHPGVMTGTHAGLSGQIQGASPKGDSMMKEEILPRRAVLRGALVVGCGLLLPGLFSGCDSKKGTSASGSAPANPPATGADSAAPATAKKAPKASVQYQTQPKGEQKCGLCQHFIAESKTCKRVEGQISPDGWCVMWMKKA
jgi:uncharacterized protein YjbJ (UPF0337 family)